MSRLSVLLLDTEPRTHNHYITLAIADALRRHPAVATVALGSHGDAARLIHDEGLDTLVAFGGSERHTDLLVKLCGLVRLSILWTTEDPYQLAGNVRTSTAFDAVFTNDKASLAAYGGRASHLPLAASPLFQDLPVRQDDREYRYDLLFIGTAWPNRVRTLNHVTEALGPGLRLKLALPWNDFIGPPDLDRDDLLTDWRCSNRDFARFANASRVVLTLPRVFSAAGDGQATGSTPPPRLFETALAGGFQVMVSPEVEIGSYYEPGRELLTCRDDAEAVSLIRAMLAEPEPRIAMAERARARTLGEHLYDHRVARMLDLAIPAAGTARARPAPNARKAVLFVAHNRLGRQAGGGVEIYQEILAAELEDAFDVFFLYPAVAAGHSVLRLEGRGVSREIAAATMTSELIRDSRIESFFEEVLVEFAIDLVHIHHLLYLPLSLPRIARALGIPTVWQIHDYYLICDRYNLLTLDDRFCDVVRRGPEPCDACLLALDDRPPGTKARRDGITADIASIVDAFVAGTPFSGEYLRGFFPEIPAERVHTIELPSTGRHPAPPPPRPDDDAATLHVAIPGNFTRIKGGAYLLELMRLCADYDIHFHVFGLVQDRLQAQVSALGSDRVDVRNGYRTEEIVGLLAQCEVSLHLSIWPETFMLSLTEAWQAGLVPIVGDLGGPADRVRDGIDGFKVPPNDPTAAFGRLQALYFDRARIRAMRDAIAAKTFPTARENAARVRALYDGLIGRYPTPHNRVPDLKSPVSGLTLFDTGRRVNSAHWVDRVNLWDGATEVTAPTVQTAPAAIVTELSAAERALPVEKVGAAPPGGSYHLDWASVDGRAIPPEARDVAFREIGLHGWMVGSGRAAPKAAYLRLRGADSGVTARLHPVATADLAHELGCPPGAVLGFRGTLSVEGLPDGLYAVDLLQSTDAAVLLRSAAMTLAVQSPLGPGRAQPWFWSDESRARFAAPSPSGAPARIAAHNLRSVGDLLIGTGRDTWWLHGSGLLDLPGRDAVQAVLEADGRIAHRADIALRGGGNDFALATQLKGVAPGTYRLGIAHRRGGETILQPTGLRLHRSACLSPCALDDAPPSGFGEPERRSKAKLGFVLDTLFERTDEAGIACPDLVSGRGWSFAAGIGAPAGCVVTWLEGGRTRYAISPPLPRLDVAEARKSPDAEGAGYEFDLPREAVESRTPIRFFQLYPRQVVEAPAFDGLLRDRLAGSGGAPRREA